MPVYGKAGIGSFIISYPSSRHLSYILGKWFIITSLSTFSNDRYSCLHMNQITMQLVADKYIRIALEEDINSEDVSTNAVMPEYKKGEVKLVSFFSYQEA